MKKILFISTILLAFLTLNVCSQEPDIEIMVGEIKPVAVDTPTRVSVQDPDIVEIAKVADKEIIIAGKSEGTTNVMIWDKGGEIKYIVRVQQIDLELAAEEIKDILHEKLGIKKVNVKINPFTGKIMLIGYVDEKDKIAIDTVLQPFADRVENLVLVKKEETMVRIDVEIMELNKNDLDRLGIKWMEFMQLREEPYVPPTGTGIETTLNRITSSWGQLFTVRGLSRDALHARIDLLIRDGKGKQLARPKLLCLSGEEAKLTVGGEVPYISATTVTATGLGNTIEYKEYGVILKIRPVVTENDRILINLESEVSELDWDNALTLSGTRVPAFSKREAQTVLNLNSGDMIFIAGLLQNRSSDTIDKIPALGNIPILGALFRSKEFQADQTELVISLTPQVIKLGVDEEVEVKGLLKSETKKVSLESLTGLPEGIQTYILEIQRKILDSVSYPSTLLGTGWEGSVVVKLYITPIGELKDVRVVKSSGHRIFDQEAVNLVKSLSYSPFPSDVRLDELKIEVPIVYSERQ